MTCGYIYVVSHPDLEKGDRKIGGSVFHPFEVTARWERLGMTERPLRLHSMAFVSDVGTTRTALNTYLARLREASSRAGLDNSDLLPRRHLGDAMRVAIAEDQARMVAAFDTHTGLFLNPAERLSGPPLRLVQDIAARMAPEGRAKGANLFREPCTIGLLWSLIVLRANELHVPPIYIPEMYRALCTRLWGVRPSNAEMREVLTTMRRGSPEYRLGRYAFQKFVRGPMGWNPDTPEAYVFLTQFARTPERALARAYDSYARTHYRRPSVRLLNGINFLFRVAVLAALVFGLEALLVGGGPEAPIRTLIAAFASGLFLLAFNFFEPPDTARLLGMIGQRDWQSGRARIDRLFAPPS